ncbi:hypothetical protein NEMBOFW57_004099 [Staphylotrichum longicolle]|uniref:DUF1479-domain-containing protein n=1 Tax=Staphylotrichum longicolle TaxID=669026 RepID=A0AAD4F8Z9_9PEZI|nr:hypothetical protein NEMBOFW57_004099 [Staphylotrichum longicolle]
MSAMNASPGKAEGDISDTFASLSGRKPQPLPDRFRELKLRLAAGREDAIIASWNRLLDTLRKENDLIARAGPSIIPEVRFSHLHDDLAALKPEIKKRGVAVIRGVIPEDEARSYKFSTEEYIRQNPRRELRRPRLRIRQPGDAQFALGPHQDGGSVERWEETGYGRGGVYDAVFEGRWDAAAAPEGEGGYDAFDAAGRVGAVTDLYGGLGACSMFRMFQGWLALSRTGPGEGTLQVNPLVKETGVYALLRPFFRARRGVGEVEKGRFLEAENWEFTGGEAMGSELQGAMPGCAQEFPEGMHPHLELERTMVNVPEVRPGDYVVWHCDTIHAVDKTHAGKSDSSVLYIPVCPTTKASAEYVARQRAAFLQGTPGPDFPGGEGESRHIGRATEEYVKKYCEPLGVQAMGLDKLVAMEGDTPGGKAVVKQANAVLGF